MKATSKKASSKERASDIMFLFQLMYFNWVGAGSKSEKLLTLHNRPKLRVFRFLGSPLPPAPAAPLQLGGGCRVRDCKKTENL